MNIVFLNSRFDSRIEFSKVRLKMLKIIKFFTSTFFYWKKSFFFLIYFFLHTHKTSNRGIQHFYKMHAKLWDIILVIFLLQQI